MNYLAPLGRVFGNLKGLYSGINGATLTGAIDVIIVEKEDGTYNCSPFHVRFGKLGVLRSREKVVDLEVNGHSVPIRMKLGDSGEAFFVQEFSDEEELEDENLATSPLPSSPQLSDTDLLLNSRNNEMPEGVPISPSNQQAIQEDSSDQLKESSVSSSKPEENKTRRKRRKRRRNNNGSKSDIKVEALTADELIDGGDEDIFKMDEELESIESSSLPVPEMGKMSGSRSFHRDFYSDTEVDATNTPHPSRPSTPIQSDSELEVSKTHMNKDGDEEVGKWAWGELPSTGTSTPAITPATGNDEKPKDGEGKVEEEKRVRTESVNKSMLAGMFSFMKGKGVKGTETTAPPAHSAMYLDDLNLEQMDPEVAALYFPNFGKAEREGRENVEEDVESGKGSSLPHSPAPGSPRNPTMAAFMEAHSKRQSDGEGPLFEGVSFCGSQLGLFDQSQMTFDELVENPSLLLNAAPESIVVKIDGRLVPWLAALPQLFSTTFFKRPLPQKVYENLIDQYTKKEGIPALPTSGSPSKEDKETGDKRRGYTWFPWGAKAEEGKEKPISAHTSSDESELNIESKSPPKTPPKTPPKSSPTPPKDLKPEEEITKILNKPAPIDIIGMNNNRVSPDKFKKSLRLTTEQIRELGLKYGQNEAVFSVTTAYQGTTVARCHIYLWRHDDRVVISDIDGTITKSDVLGHILPIIGNDWAQSGVAHLFTQIQDNGYKMLYLSARAIGQATITREYLKSIKQGDVTLPDGPLLLNPTSLMSALHREVIEKKPEEFKIACLKDVQRLFTDNPFYAGYGNKINDVWAYRAVDIPISRIFTINHKGELRHALTNTFQSSYTSLVELADHIFPVYKNTQTYQDPSQIDDFNNFEFWRDPILPLEAP